MSQWFFVFIDEVASLAEQAREGRAMFASEKKRRRARSAASEAV